ncbi:MAG TPA: hypothetical protein VGQ81_04365 [Acidobacteriota bacterium]|jgi:hypothetical protein|nr:hypothetical protein [Acidobacteriota bacterium]
MREKAPPAQYVLNQKAIQAVRDEIARYDIYRLTREIGRFADQQPEAVVFVAEVLRPMRGEVTETGIFISFSIFRIMDSLFKSEIPAVSMKLLRQKLRENQIWIHHMGRMERRMLKRRLRYSEEFAQPNLIRFLLDELNTPPRTRRTLNGAETGLLFLLGKTLTDALMTCLKETG